MNSLPESVLEQFGANAEYVAELYAQWRYSPVTVSEEWRRYFEGLGGGNGAAAPTSGGNGQVAPSGGNGSTATPAPAHPVTAAAPQPTPPAPATPPPTALPAEAAVTSAALVDPVLAAYEEAQPIRGVAALIVDNMEDSLGLPVATSQRYVPVKVLEENRRTINQWLEDKGRKASFTHIIAWAIVQALKAYPQLNAAYALVGNKPHRIARSDVNLGLAIDMERKDGSRSLIVPNIKGANHLNFDGFLAAYDDLIRRARAGKLTTEDYQGTTVTLTNPGTIGTVVSVPRLMVGQGLIVATGAIEYPAEYTGTSETMLTELGISKVMGMTSTYDHRIIQGAESGMFLAKVHELLQGGKGVEFYDGIFADLRIPYPPVRWAKDRGPLLAGGSPERIAEKQAGVMHLIRASRVRGHLLADLNPLGSEATREYHPDLDPATYGLTLWDLDREFATSGLAGLQRAPLRQILDILRRTYSSHYAVEYMNIQNPEEREWLQAQMERAEKPKPLSAARKHFILRQMSEAEAFERFLHQRYVGSKRFSLEGAETVIAVLGTILDRAAQRGVAEAVLGMAHRGRLNVLYNVMQKPAHAIFQEFEGTSDRGSVQGSGDVKYHLGAEGTRKTHTGQTLDLTLAPNPSHLEAVDPVVIGMAYAKQRQRQGERAASAVTEVLPVLIHGDAAFAGQGVVAEVLQMAQLRGYGTGGTIHVIINNQIGFTTEPEDARSTPFATDIAKMSQVPIFHVNADDPEAAVRVGIIAMEYRQKFHKDVIIDLIGYRRWGHNEADDPSYTQPEMYRIIEKRKSPREVYAQQLAREKAITQEDAQRFYDEAMAQLDKNTEGLKELQPPKARLEYDEGQDIARQEPTQTAVARDTLIRISQVLANPPETFITHPKLAKQIKRRELQGDGSDRVDWATAEEFAFGSLLLEGHPVRLSGQDSGRGTFSQRHAVLHNYETGEDFIPLNHLAEQQVPFTVYNSLLSEVAVMGFEFGYTMAAREALVLWEAQFGDFANGAQVVIDQFISSSAAKWNRPSDIVLLLPHGYEGQGPEHSSARLERYLQLCAENNMAVAYPTTPANYFHLLRRQKKDILQRPLIVMTPKSLLRLPAAASTLEEFTEGDFRHIIDDATVADPARVRRVVFVSGKLFYDLAAKKGEEVAVVRVEQLYPYPRPQIQAALARYPQATEFIWAQEEPRNQGAWGFIRSFLEADLPEGATLQYVGRAPAASPATGSFAVHQQEQEFIVSRALG